MTTIHEDVIVRLRMHRDYHGYWADSADIPNWTIVGDSALEVMQLVNELGQDLPQFLELGPLPVDLRWQWCDDPNRTVVGMRLSGTNDPPGAQHPALCRHAKR